jgi:hypothetical protein
MIVTNLIAGVVGRNAYGLDERGQVFRLDAKGRPIEPPEKEPLATRIREAIEEVRLAECRSDPPR